MQYVHDNWFYEAMCSTGSFMFHFADIREAHQNLYRICQKLRKGGSFEDYASTAVPFLEAAREAKMSFPTSVCIARYYFRIGCLHRDFVPHLLFSK